MDGVEGGGGIVAGRKRPTARAPGEGRRGGRGQRPGQPKQVKRVLRTEERAVRGAERRSGGNVEGEQERE